ncbi:sulfite exporter TauE/SafE family protein [Asanoa sp. WMMD1127]|uniref:nickel/cobalt transporter n=1 Tax=Asanoa sp. WMMD1127 TaxID=3016107 RepID=UPI002417DED5|nr:sulfite exporter TauE/SafE family protein [Asanoa sp. WMMD1127]MDG4822983.1 sulfite exporter TauE/SafE family protein [Asanoa sp. WMMD1127]
MTGLDGLDNRLITLFDGGAVFWLLLLVALGVGAAHAVAPGHGKTITAAYLVGTHGRYRDALRLGVIVAVMHTFSVLVLALVWVGLSMSMSTRSLTAWLQVAAGLVVIAVGGRLAWRQLRHRHQHAHGHSHAHPHGHSHGPDEATDPWSRQGLVALALSGGLLPSPSAFLLLVSGLLTGRSVDALVLVLAFGVGMAVTLTAVGMVTVRGFGALAARTRRWAAVAAWTPAVAGLAVATAGFLYVAMAVSVLTA